MHYLKANRNRTGNGFISCGAFATRRINKIDKLEHSENEQTFMVHKRLAIVAPGRAGNNRCTRMEETDVFYRQRGDLYHQKLRETFNIEHPNKSDCQVIGHVYEKFGALEFKHLDGMLPRSLKIEKRKAYRRRDHGKIPMYMAKGSGSFWFAWRWSVSRRRGGVVSVVPPVTCG